LLLDELFVAQVALDECPGSSTRGRTMAQRSAGSSKGSALAFRPRSRSCSRKGLGCWSPGPCCWSFAACPSGHWQKGGLSHSAKGGTTRPCFLGCASSTRRRLPRHNRVHHQGAWQSIAAHAMRDTFGSNRSSREDAGCPSWARDGVAARKRGKFLAPTRFANHTAASVRPLYWQLLGCIRISRFVPVAFEGVGGGRARGMRMGWGKLDGASRQLFFLSGAARPLCATSSNGPARRTSILVRPMMKRVESNVRRTRAGETEGTLEFYIQYPSFENRKQVERTSLRTDHCCCCWRYGAHDHLSSWQASIRAKFNE
jgi:hypothetical protein